MSLQQDNESAASDNIDVKRLYYKITSYWPFILTSVIFALGASFFISRSIRNLYEVESILIIEDQSSDNMLSGAENVISLTWSDANPLAGRKAILKSHSLNYQLAKNLGWEVSYWSRGRIKENEVYDEKPFEVDIDFNTPQFLGVNFNLKLGKTGFELTPEKVGALKRYNFNTSEIEDGPHDDFLLESNDYKYDEWIELGGSRIKVKLTQEINEEIDNFYFNLQSYDNLAQAGRLGIDVQVIEKGSDLLRVSMSGYKTSKITDYVNGLCAQLQEYELNKKNLSVDNTINFLNNQIESTEKN